MALSIFDQLSIGIVLIDRYARVVFANVAARSHATEDGSLRLNASATNLSPEHARRLGDMIRSAIDGTATRTMAVPSPSGGRPLMVIASPVRGADMDRSDIRNLRAATAMLLISDPNRPVQIPAAWIMDAYKLTLAEVRVALAVASGTTIPQAARRLRISANTVKTHLRRVYEKTGTRRQAELSRLVATISLARGTDPLA